MKRYLILITSFAALFALAVPTTVEAKKYGGGSSFKPSSSKTYRPKPAPKPKPKPVTKPSSSSSKKFTPPSSSSKEKAKAAAVTTTGATTAATATSTNGTKPADSTKTTTTRVQSKTDRAAYERAVKNGTSFKSRTAAVDDFKSKHGDKYKSTYATKPATRPDHIPEKYTDSGGTTYNVTYNQDRGGYGYYSGGGPGLGTFIMYDMMSDAIMMNSMMNNYGYHYGAAPPPVVHSSAVGLGFGAVFAIIVGGILIICLIVWGISRVS